MLRHRLGRSVRRPARWLAGPPGACRVADGPCMYGCRSGRATEQAWRLPAGVGRLDARRCARAPDACALSFFVPARHSGRRSRDVDALASLQGLHRDQGSEGSPDTGGPPAARPGAPCRRSARRRPLPRVRVPAARAAALADGPGCTSRQDGARGAWRARRRWSPARESCSMPISISQ